MPYEIVWEPLGVYRKLSGFLSNDEIRKSFDVLHENKRYTALLYILHNTSEVTGHEYTKEDALMLLANHLGASVSNPNLIDLVVNDDKAYIEMIRSCISVKLLPNQVEFFPTVDEARARIAEIVAQSNNS